MGDSAAVAAAIGAGTAGILTFVGGTLDRRGQRQAAQDDRNDGPRRVLFEGLSAWGAGCQYAAVARTPEAVLDGLEAAFEHTEPLLSGRLHLYAPQDVVREVELLAATMRRVQASIEHDTPDSDEATRAMFEQGSRLINLSRRELSIAATPRRRRTPAGWARHRIEQRRRTR